MIKIFMMNTDEDLSTQDIVSLCKELKTNTTVMGLCLNSLRLKHSQYHEKTNSFFVCLTGNIVGYRGSKALSEMLYTNTTIREIKLRGKSLMFIFQEFVTVYCNVNRH